MPSLCIIHWWMAGSFFVSLRFTFFLKPNTQQCMLMSEGLSYRSCASYANTGLHSFELQQRHIEDSVHSEVYYMYSHDTRCTVLSEFLN